MLFVTCVSPAFIESFTNSAAGPVLPLRPNSHLRPSLISCLKVNAQERNSHPRDLRQERPSASCRLDAAFTKYPALSHLIASSGTGSHFVAHHQHYLPQVRCSISVLVSGNSCNAKFSQVFSSSNETLQLTIESLLCHFTRCNQSNYWDP
jgi:hypothetical protein